MRQRYRPLPFVHPSDAGKGPHSIMDLSPPDPTMIVREHTHRYTAYEAWLVSDWLNGNDRPLDNMVERSADPRDPAHVTHYIPKGYR